MLTVTAVLLLKALGTILMGALLCAGFHYGTMLCNALDLKLGLAAA